MDILCVPVGPLQANCYLICDEQRRACAVDPGGEPERLAQIVKREVLTLEAILVTHGHFDHTEGVAGLARATGAHVYCSAQTAPVLTGAEGCPATGQAVPSLTSDDVTAVGDGSTVSVGGFTVKVLATPGHTPGDLTYEIEGGLFCGDLLFRESVGRTDFPGGDFAQLLSSIGRLAQLYPEEARVYPGHMGATSLGHELRHNMFLSELSPRG